MWTKENRRRYDRSPLRHEHDLTDEEWAEIWPEIPPAKPGGNKRMVNLRDVVNGVMYILGTGCQWRAIPKYLPPRSTIHDYLDRWTHDGTPVLIHHGLYVKCREQVGREASPTIKRSSILIGKRRTRMPVACQTALATAPAVPVMPISPTPLMPSALTCGSCSSTRIASSEGTSAFTGTWYSARFGVHRRGRSAGP